MPLQTKLSSSVKGRLLAALLGAGVAGPSAYVAVELTAPSEGLYLTPYKDPVGLTTICLGHLVKKGEKVKELYTVEECAKIFAKDWKEHEILLDKVVKVPYRSPWMKAAFTDFTFNKGIGNVSSSTLLRKLNSKDYDGACQELTKWVFATEPSGKKVKLKGLEIRATAQYKYCMGEVPADYQRLQEAWLGDVQRK